MSAEVYTKAEWLEHRKSHIGASEVAAIIGEDPRRGPLSVYASKVTGDSQEDNDWMAYGRDVESAIANMYASKTGREVEDLGATSFQYHPDIPYLAATLDRVTWDYEDDPGPLELKSVDPFGTGSNPKDWKRKPLPQYLIQLQIQMACTNASWGSLAGLFPGYQLAWHDTKRDDVFLELVYPALEQFWDRVKRRDPPPPGIPCKAYDTEAVKMLYPHDDGTTVELGQDVIDNVNEWERLGKVESEAKKQRRSLESRIRSSMKYATYGDLGDGTMVSLKKIRSSEYTVGPREYRVLRRHKNKS